MRVGGLQAEEYVVDTHVHYDTGWLGGALNRFGVKVCKQHAREKRNRVDWFWRAPEE